MWRPVPPTKVPEERFRYTGTATSSWFRAVDLNLYPLNRTVWAIGEAFGKIYIGLCGEHEGGAAHLAAYNPKADKVEEICDVEKFLGSPGGKGKIPHAKIHFAICKVTDGEGRKVYFGTHIGGGSGEDDINKGVGIGPMCHPTEGYEGGHIFLYRVDEGRVEDLGIPVEHEGIRCMKVSKDGAKLFGITFPKVRFFEYDVRTRRTTYLSERIGKIGGIDLWFDATGDVYGVSDGFKRKRIAGLLYRYHPESQRLEDLNLVEPKLGPRCHTQFHNHLLHATPGPHGDVILSCYGECNIALFQTDNAGHERLYDLGLSWDIPKSKDKFPYFAWVPQFAKPRLYTIGGETYDTLVWYGHERWEYKESVRLACLAYNHERLDRVVKVMFGNILVDGHMAAHWGAAASDEDNRIYYGDRYVTDKKISLEDAGGKASLRLLIFTPPDEIAPVEKIPWP